MRHVLWAIGSFLVLGFAAFLAVNAWVSAAYGFADGYPLAQVSSRDDLRKLGGTSIGFLVAGLLAVAFLAFVVTAILLIGSRTRRLAWLVPLSSVLLVAIVTALATTMFEPPPPDLGG